MYGYLSGALTGGVHRSISGTSLRSRIVGAGADGGVIPDCEIDPATGVGIDGCVPLEPGAGQVHHDGVQCPDVGRQIAPLCGKAQHASVGDCLNCLSAHFSATHSNKQSFCAFADAPECGLLL